MRDERLFPLFAGLDTLSGVGPKLLPVLQRLCGGNTVWDLLLHLPDRWIDRRMRAHFDETVPGEIATVRGDVIAHHAPYNDRSPYRIQLGDDTGFLTLSYFRADPRWLKSQFPIGASRIVSGRVEDYKGERQITHPDFVVDPAKNEPPPEVEPIYPLSAGLTNRRVHVFALQALGLVPDGLPEWSDPHLVRQRGWPGFREALTILHAPTRYDEDEFARARERLAYDEAVARASAFSLARAARKARRAPVIRADAEAERQLIRALPYTPTGAQRRATDEIRKDLASGAPMRRLLQGDVGAGKTLVAAFAAVEAAASGFQSAFMAPTEVLARQQFDTLDSLLSPLGYTVAVLSGRDRGSARESTLMALADGTIQIVTGTHALFQEAVSFRNLGLIIVDEQHRFGVTDRMRLVGKSDSPHMLVMSATPIPRTLAQAVHGDLDVSILDEKPPGRKPVETRAIPDTRLEEVIEAIGRALKRGERAFWVCPRVDADEDDSSAVARHAALQDELRIRVGLVHGRLRPAEKDAALEDFRSGKTRVLVATTVIEVGVDVPEATIMVIERAEGFGLAQLHQLRGRVGRGERASYCILLYRPPLGEAAHQRLDTLRRTEDGFEIAEADFRLRGAGDVLGVRQAGATEYRVLDMARHSELLEIAGRDADAVIAADPRLKGERANALRIARELLTPRVTIDSDAGS
ncbi:MAG: ATP-dependent DNA helicase RecG [Hyphomonas sp.]|uniref:ATP-dependent DNA helicase RecG n=1 Tax=Hyphomonas sp. TaxID=87 RepID=UPI00179D7876|nr:ATP-dependent DNA helicase RecG [Hyphomonas sp.]MBU3922598.1 ATP-dependent DNA helicase RecG [Alphaproteobacteria bacterium]MBA3067212.1 ATP-dependent DNA helicase RecG [Hyphomonas sp.]MBU4061178.1 ATP-dependent DNA helicase RecG [Alphaproteobacteria bacterium]MBU4165090.1 ATP-dependent DNA helicase RecG [Alphaproteobacteria bacterium]MBU4567379.1 ATP-dependent DNA helicase RecG [Alphaproteobacteria bacterium]